MRTSLLLVCVAGLAGCSRPTTTSATNDAASVSPSASSSSSAPSASSSSSASRSPVNLLHMTDGVVVTLSSRVDNPRDYPEHITDGKPETAWNGKTGDKNAWIEVTLPPGAHVDAVMLTAGFDKGALFEQNLRIKKVKVERDGALVREATLDPAVRAPQRIPIDGPGGTYRITVLETATGSNPAWQEIVVSELVFLGTPPKDKWLASPQLPKVVVADEAKKAPERAKELFEVTVEGREGASIDAVCAAWKAEVLAVVHRMQKAGQGLEGYDEKSVSCTQVPGPPLTGALPDGWSIATAVTLEFFDGVASKEDRYLVLRRKDGRIVGGPLYATANDIGDSAKPQAFAAAVGASLGKPVLLVSNVAIEIPLTAWRPDGTPDPDAEWRAVQRGRLCRFDVARVSCDQPFPMSFATRTLSAVEKKTRGKDVKAETPVVEATTGKMRETRE